MSGCDWTETIKQMVSGMGIESMNNIIVRLVSAQRILHLCQSHNELQHTSTVNRLQHQYNKTFKYIKYSPRVPKDTSRK